MKQRNSPRIKWLYDRSLSLLTIWILIRALENPKFILLDEGDFFRKSEQEDVRFVTERYIGKSDPYIVMVSTPNAPNGLFDKIETGT